ncbi:hypothetical protein Verru16b_01454 [Lacunisphaera limnophila]|uniref:Outer membrane lipoprotein carrier protein LolA n=1 Tax=Lacunisphaera limnophila TaxID=1838286 RepID=A0A1D8AU25_9BACT|nr:hypothetical protein [Lacunisphaera limnophila]AOS44392.1 hypothetical protein Verru16b_01454 [Lacunisphaera limnophila]
MKRMRLPVFLLGLLLAVSLRAGSLESAYQARAMLGADVWSRVVRIENEASGRGSRYPAEFHGLVVAFEGILWLYTEYDGTQSISRYAGRLEQDQADLGPLLQAVEPGLTRFEDVTAPTPFAILGRPPPYACFPAAVARWQQLQREAKPPARARLLAIYPEGHRQGHMVLEYWREGRRYVFDPARPTVERELSLRLTEDPLKVARALFAPRDGKRPVRAMHLDLEGPGIDGSGQG